jgi:hypothetical protein
VAATQANSSGVVAARGVVAAALGVVMAATQASSFDTDN